MRRLDRRQDKANQAVVALGSADLARIDTAVARISIQGERDAANMLKTIDR